MASRRRQHPVEDHRAHLPREAPDVVLRDARAVGDAVEVDARIAERAAHLLEVLHRDAGGVVGDRGARDFSAARQVRVLRAICASAAR